MKHLWIKRAGILALFFCLVAGVTGSVWRYGYLQALDQVARRGAADLALAVDRLDGQLLRYREMAVLMADHPVLTVLTEGADTRAAQRLLVAAADKTSAMDLFYVDPLGRVLAKAGKNAVLDVAQTSYFRRAMQGALGVGHGIYPQTDQRTYYFAAPSFGANGQVSGALVVVVDIDNVEWEWRGSNPAVFFSDEKGNIFLTNRSEILFWQHDEAVGGLHPIDQEITGFSQSVQGGHVIWRLKLGDYIPNRALYLARDLPVIGMRGAALIDVAPARRLAGLQAAVVGAIFLAFGAMLFLVTQRRRALAIANTQLEGRVEARTAQLRKAQNDLVQAGKLAALGQMSAGISHELNQPLMAIQQFAENGGRFLERGKTQRAQDNLLRIGDMSARMSRIIKNLRAFARQESIALGRVNLVSVIDLAVDLTAPRMKEDGISLVWERPEAPIFVLAGEVRLGQVFVNLITNAADAMADSARREISIAIESREKLRVVVCDTGPGIDDPDKIFEPFYSTKSVGGSDGMGLGLSISYGLVQSFGGNIRGINGRDGGAVFTVDLEYWQTGEPEKRDYDTQGIGG